MVRKEDKKEGRVMLSVWVPTELIKVIDRRVSEVQAGTVEKIHRSDVVREVLLEWAGLTPRPEGPDKQQPE